MVYRLYGIYLPYSGGLAIDPEVHHRYRPLPQVSVTPQKLSPGEAKYHG